MSIPSKAWFLYPSPPSESAQPGTLVQEEFSFSDISPDELLVEPLYGCWEWNMEHSLSRRPIDICRTRGEERVIIGNSGVVRVMASGRDIHAFAPGQYALLFSASVIDSFGYPERILGYDACNTMGCLSSRIKVKEHELVSLPERTRHSLAQWAAFSVRYITAWSNWELAYGTFRLLVSCEELANPHVWGWSGGTTLAELQLAGRQGCRTVMLSGNDLHLKQICKAGITPLDRRNFDHLFFDDKRYSEDPAFRRAYVEAERCFLKEVRERTNNERVQIFVDYIGSPVFRATYKALSREGVITTAGWKEGMNITYLRATECIARHQFIHTHYARHSQAVAAVTFAEEHGWMPEIDERIYRFDEIPELAEDFHHEKLGYFPVYSVNAE